MALTIPTYDPVLTQNTFNFLYYVIFGFIITAILVFIAVKIFRLFSYTYHVEVFDKVGDTEVQYSDLAKQVKLDGNYMYHYNSMDKFSPVIHSKFHRIVQKKLLFGLINWTKRGFAVYRMGESLFPMAVKNNPGLEPMNLDLFNYMQSRLKANQNKYIQIEQWKQLLPYIALGAVVLMFIV